MAAVVGSLSRREQKNSLAGYQSQFHRCWASGDLSGVARAQHHLGVCYLDQGLLTLAATHFLHYLDYSRASRDRVSIATGCNNVGLVCRMLGIHGYREALKEGRCEHAREILKQNLHRAVSYHQEGLSLLSGHTHLKRQAGCYVNLACCHELLKEYSEAIYCYNKQLELVRMLGDKVSESSTLCCLGNCYRALGRLGPAQQYYTMCYQLAVATGNRSIEGTALLNLGATCELSNSLARAAEWHTLYLAVMVEVGDVQGEARALGSLTALYEEMGQQVKAILCCTRLEDAFGRLEDRPSQQAVVHKAQKLRRSRPHQLRSRFQRSLSKRGKLGRWSITRYSQRPLPLHHFSTSLLFENPLLQEREEHPSLSGQTTPDPSSSIGDPGYAVVRRPLSLASESTYAQSTSNQSIPSDLLSCVSGHTSRGYESVTSYYTDSTVDKEWEQWINLRDVNFGRVVSMTRGEIRDKTTRFNPTHSAPLITTQSDSSIAVDTVSS